LIALSDTKKFDEAIDLTTSEEITDIQLVKEKPTKSQFKVRLKVKFDLL
jgi:hypothetical protein